MKKSLLKILLVIMSLALTLFAVSCSGGKTSESEVESVSTSEVTSSPESESSSNVEEIPIVGAGENGEVNLGEVLDLLAPVLNNNYITVNFTMDSSSTIDSVKVAYQTKVTAYAKKTLNGYDVIATFKQDADVQGSSVPVREISIYYVDGLAVYGITDYNVEEPKAEWYKFEAGTFNELINALNVMIASDEDALATYREVMKAVEKLEIILSEQDLTNKNIPLTFDFAEYANNILDFVIANKDENLYDFLLKNVWGVNVDDPDAVVAFENEFIEMCTANPTVAEVINGVVDALNATLMEEARQEAAANGTPFDESAVFQLDLEELCGLLQEQFGITTAQVVELIKQSVPELSDYLTAPEEGEGIYDYFMTRAQMVTVDDLAKVFTGDPEATLITAIGGLKVKLTNITLGEFVDGVLEEYFGTTAPSGNQQTGEVGQVNNSYIDLIDALNVDVQALILGITFKTDAYGRPTELGMLNRVQASYLNTESSASSQIITATVENSTKITFSYSKSFVDFTIPQEYLDLAVEA